MHQSRAPSPLASLLRRRKDDLIQRWTVRVLNDPDVPQANRLDRPRLIDHIPEILDVLIRGLERRTGETGEESGRSVGVSAPAERHAQLRILHGYSLAEALRELSHLRCALIELRFEEGVVLEAEEILMLHSTIDEMMGLGAVEVERMSRVAAEEEIAFRDYFMAILGHDLRNPLNSIVFSVATLMKDDDAASPRTKALRRISAATERIGHMLDDLMDLSRSRLGGGLPLNVCPTNMGVVCAGVVEEFEGARQTVPLVLETRGDLDGLWDSHRLMQLVSNLVGNAIEFSTPGAPVRVSAEDSGPAVLVRVHNEGRPIPSDVLPTLFDPFRQGSQEGRERRGVGLGLGLFIAQQIARAHGGSIKVESEEGSGTTFTARLPRSGI